MYENHDLVKNGLKMVKMANRSLHQSSFRLDMRYRKFEAFLETSSFFPVVWRGITLLQFFPAGHLQHKFGLFVFHPHVLAHLNNDGFVYFGDVTISCYTGKMKGPLLIYKLLKKFSYYMIVIHSVPK